MTFEYHFAVEDPAYGTRIFRRRIRLETRGTTIVAGLEDCMHACKLVLDIDAAKQTIVGIKGTWFRHPNLSCRDAPEQFAPFVGKPLTAQRATLRDYVDVRQQCTHFHDLLGLAMSHALRGDAVRQYDVAVPDRIDGKTTAEVLLNGGVVHRWDLHNDNLVGPDDIKGQPLEKGFSRWASALYAGDALEAAHVLQMGIFVSRANHLDFKAMAARFPGIVLAPPELVGACYALQEERMPEAMPCHDIRDFTHAADRMLTFL